MVGIKELAETLNLSISTVSRALNGRPDASEATRRRVLAAAKALGYSANQSGRSLRQGTTEAVGFMIDLDNSPGSPADNFFTSAFEGVKRALSPHNLDLVVLPRSADENSDDYLRRIVQRRLVDGVIISATRRKDGRIDILQAAGVPFVTLGRSQAASDYAWVDLDFEGYVRVSLQRLAALGHRRVAVCVYEPGLNLGFVLREAFRQETRRLGLDQSPALEIAVSSADGGGAELADRLLALAEPPTAVLLSYELMAIGLYHRLAARGLVPGRDIAVLGLRESPVSSSLTPRLTCYRVDLIGLGMALGRMLLAQMPAYAEAYANEPTGRLWPLAIVPGESDAFRPAARPGVIQSLAGGA